MGWHGEIGRRLRALWHRDRIADELDEEMRLHVALRRERPEQASTAADAADLTARRRFGDPLRLREDAMDAWGWRWLEQAAQDVRFAIRTLIANPGFALAAVGTLALGIGANTTVFSVVSAAVVRPLPFADPNRLVQIYGTSPLEPHGGPLSNLAEFRRRSRSLEAVAGSEVTARYRTRPDGLEQVMAVRAERDFFSILGVPPLQGRTFRPDDPMTVAVVAENYWKERMAGDPSIVGSTILLDDLPYTIIGVMPASFQFPYRAASILTGVAAEGRTDVWLPLDPRPRGRMAQVVGRLRRGVDPGSAQSELTAIARRLEEENPDLNRGRGVRVVRLSDAVVSSEIRRPLLLLFGAIGLLLVLACSNVASLLLVRLSLRGREIAVRRALGAGRLRLLRQFTTESLLLSAAGGAAGLALAWWGTKYVMVLARTRFPRAQEIGIDWRVFLFLFSISTLIGLGLGLAPALTLGRKDPQRALQASGTHSSTMGVGSRRLRDTLVVAEVALAFVLAVGAAVLIRELVRLRATNPGVVTTNVVTFHIANRVKSMSDGHQFYEIADRVAALPGVRAAGFTQLLPLQNWGWTSNSSDFHVPGRPAAGPVFPIELRYVTPGYFHAFGIPIRTGRGFTDHDSHDAAPVILINETLARLSFPGENPVGTLTNRGMVVGIVGDVRQASLDRPSLPELYFPIAQNWSQLAELGLTLIVSTRDPPRESSSPFAPSSARWSETRPSLASRPWRR